jgi:Zn-finger nucleic acid-binding protein
MMVLEGNQVDCANCKNPMITAELESVEIDFCSGCGGIWLDAGELESLLADDVRARQAVASLVPVQDCAENKRRCPVCRKKMVKVNAGQAGNITLLDRCPGHGLWFDRGELKQVLQNTTLDQNGKIVKILKDMFGDMDF